MLKNSNTFTPSVNN